MNGLLCQKFMKPDLRGWLKHTDPQTLIEWNDWGDRFWGRDRKTGEGLNVLGQLLMDIRKWT